jgi:hypothetical protein
MLMVSLPGRASIMLEALPDIIDSMARFVETLDDHIAGAVCLMLLLLITGRLGRFLSRCGHN